MGTSVQPLPPIQDALAAIRAQSGARATSLPPIQQALAQIRARKVPGVAAESTGVARSSQTQPTKSPVFSLGTAEAAVQGLLGGFADEVGGAGAAALDKLTGQPGSFGQNYTKYRDIARNIDQQYAQQHPAAHTIAELAGGAIPAWITGGAMSGEAAPSLLAQMGRGALTGAATGAVYGAGNAQGSLANRAAGAIKGGTTGAIVGGVAPAVVSGGTRLVRAAMGKGADDRALAMMSRALSQDKITPQDLAQRADAAAQTSSPMIAADLGGKNTAGVVRWATSQPSSLKDEMITNLENRQAGQFDRIVQEANAATGNQFPNATAAQSALESTRAVNAQANYQAAFQKGPYSGKILDQALQSPAFAKALDVGKGLAAQDDIAEAIKNGTPIPPPQTSIPAHIANDPKLLALLQQQGVLPQNEVSLKALDFAKQYLDKGIERGFDANSGFDHTTATVTRNILQQVLKDVDQQFPEYAAARAGYTADSGPLNALEVGQNALRTPPDELTAATAKMSPQERQAVVSGAMDALKNKGATVADKNDLSAQFLANPAMRERMQAVAPSPQSFDQLMSLRDRETAMARTLRAAVGGSDTERNRILSGALDAITPSDIAVAPISPHRSLMRIAGRLGQRYMASQNTKTAEALAPYLQAPVGTPALSDLIQGLMGTSRRLGIQQRASGRLASLLAEGGPAQVQGNRR